MAKKQKLELTWIGKDEEVRLEPRVLVEDTELSYGDENTENMIIHGDNLLALKALEQDYAGKVKCIYIDPPYNTGNAFEHYDDGVEHSIWLSLMKQRLELLWNLLDKKDGYMAVQIDDNEFARLYLLMIEICGERNLKTITVKMSEASGLKMGSVKKSGRIPKLKEFIIIAKKDGIKNLNVDLVPKSEWDKEYNIFWENFTKEDKNILDEIANRENLTEEDLVVVDNILKNIQTVSVSQKIKELDIDKKQVDNWKFENSWRILRTAASKSVYALALEKKQFSDQNIFSVLSKRDKILYYAKGDVSEEAKNPRVQYIFAEDNLMVHPGDLWLDLKTTGLEAEGNVDFKNGKKPEELIRRIINLSTKEGDLILDSFAGSGTTASVAHKMNRKYISIELGEHAKTHVIKRLQNIIDNKDEGGISQKVNWQGGGGFKFYTLAPSLLTKDKFGNWVIEPSYDATLLASAMAKQEGFKYYPDENLFWKQGFSTETDYIFTTTQFVTTDLIDKIHDEMQEEETLLVCAKSFHKACESAYSNITIKKIPQVLLGKCEFGKDDYSLNILENQEDETSEDEDE